MRQYLVTCWPEVVYTRPRPKREKVTITVNFVESEIDSGIYLWLDGRRYLVY